MEALLSTIQCGDIELKTVVNSLHSVSVFFYSHMSNSFISTMRLIISNSSDIALNSYKLYFIYFSFHLLRKKILWKILRDT